MNTNLATKQIRLREWAEIIADRARSGMTVQEYCALHAINIKTYYYRLRLVRAAAIETSGIKLEELTPPEEKAPDIQGPGPVFAPKLTISCGAFTISIREDTPPALLRQALEVIRDAQ